ncbi:type IV pilus modification PilV family protein [Paucibacter soli]|uniref:type IV pilus modification PilV family protein n=1 Tax=Paucibacter soli TaxID=3133433 RepID=UPI00309E4A0B
MPCQHLRHHHPSRPTARQQGLTLVELIVFMVVVSAALAGVLQIFVQAGAKSADPMIRRQALAIAESLLQEVQLMPFTFCDPDDPNVDQAANSADCPTQPESIGPEPGETRYSSSKPFDNVNDYQGFNMSGIRDISDTAIAGLEAYSASVTVAAAALGSIGAGSGDALQITVTVNGPGGETISLQGWRTRHAPNAAL